MSEAEFDGSGRGVPEVGKVLAFVPRRRDDPEMDFFTGEERAALRQMLREFATVKTGCPMARRLLDPE